MPQQQQQQVIQIISFDETDDKYYPKNLFLLPVIVLLNHFLAAGEIVWAIHSWSLGLITHAGLMVCNGIILSGLISAMFFKMKLLKNSFANTTVILKVNIAISVVCFCVVLICFYTTLKFLKNPPLITYESLIFLIPLPAVFLNLVGMYVVKQIQNIYKKRDREQNIVVHDSVKNNIKKNAVICYKYMLVNAIGALIAMVSLYLVHNHKIIFADAICSCVMATVIFGSAVHLIENSIRTAAARTPVHLNSQTTSLTSQIVQN